MQRKSPLRVHRVDDTEGRKLTLIGGSASETISGPNEMQIGHSIGIVEVTHKLLQQIRTRQEKGTGTIEDREGSACSGQANCCFICTDSNLDVYQCFTF